MKLETGIAVAASAFGTSAANMSVADGAQAEWALMPGWLFAVLIIASGFAAAGLFDAVRVFVSKEPGSFRLSFASPLSVIGSFLACMIAGPVWLIGNATRFWMDGHVSSGILGFCAVLSGLWSFCSGVFVFQLLVITGLI